MNPVASPQALCLLSSAPFDKSQRALLEEVCARFDRVTLLLCGHDPFFSDELRLQLVQEGCRHLAALQIRPFSEGASLRSASGAPNAAVWLLEADPVAEAVRETDFPDLPFTRIPHVRVGSLCVNSPQIRQLIRRRNIAALAEWVPESTLDFLLSFEAKSVCHKIQSLPDPDPAAS